MTQNNVLFPIADLLVVRDLYEILLELGLEWSLHIVISANQMLISCELFQSLGPILGLAPMEIPKDIDMISWCNDRIPILNQGSVHFCYRFKRTIVECDHVCVIKVGVGNVIIQSNSSSGYSGRYGSSKNSGHS